MGQGPLGAPSAGRASTTGLGMTLPLVVTCTGCREAGAGGGAPRMAVAGEVMREKDAPRLLFLAPAMASGLQELREAETKL